MVGCGTDRVDLTGLAERRWDAIVIGTGMAGATFGHQLARAGRRVLFCEMGKSLLLAPPEYKGVFSELLFPKPEVPQPKHREILASTGRYVGEVVDCSNGTRRRHVPFIGSGSGGSSVLYGGAMERFMPQDFEPRSQHPDILDSSLPDRWPISYRELAPFYEAAERLFRLRGTPDPLREESERVELLEPPPLSAAGARLFVSFQKQGLHPYRLPQACEFVPGCEGCQGFLCPKDCKNDSSRICLRPAVEEHGAVMLDECEVRFLEASSSAVTGVVCRYHDREFVLRAELVAIAAGALETPRLLLNSRSSEWPQGLANGSGLVGANLMRHYIDLYAVRVPGAALPGNQKELALNDFYAGSGDKLGTVQSFGALPPAAVLLAGMVDDIRHGRWRLLAPLLPLARPVLMRVLDGMGRRLILASIMEDLPFPDNAVRPVEDGTARLAIRYRIRPSEKARIDAFRDRLASVLRLFRFDLIRQAENNQRIAHACGTCRFGDDPGSSVLDRWNRAHGLRNLYVLDASFFPSSGGTNPALTIAANAMRVADHLCEEGP